MEATDTFSLDVAKTSFLSLLSSTDPSEVGNFMDWVIKHCSSVNSDDGTKDSANDCDGTLLIPGDKRMKKIIKDIKKRIPLDGIMSSENIYYPEGKNSDCDPSTTVHVDSFLYSDEDIDRLCDEGKMSRSYCKECGSHNTAPLTFISHSMPLLQLRFLFESALPSLLSNLNNKCLVDIGSRLGALLYFFSQAYYFSAIEKIIGVEINADLCGLQQQIIENYSMADRVEVKCADVCNELTLLKEADIIVLNNVFEFFMPVEEQIRTWKILREHLTKRGCIIVTVPSLKEATLFNNKPCVDLDEWVQPCSVNYMYHAQNVSCCDEDMEELQNMFFYQVKVN
ncbi:unnamed protein product [Porites evermanni]|uniref:Methyltransferase type 11 domain-containing protein n=1 Tax=Porites evermanni TaxID=104178 RepID=A0ABN8Q2H9_9CNID|nr:unnamed protein product [Porites evermanni]